MVEADPAGRRRGVRRPQTTRVGPPFQRRRRALRVVAAGPARAGAIAVDPGEARVRGGDERRAHRAQLDDERRQVARPEPVRRERVDDRRDLCELRVRATRFHRHAIARRASWSDGRAEMLLPPSSTGAQFSVTRTGVSAASRPASRRSAAALKRLLL